MEIHPNQQRVYDEFYGLYGNFMKKLDEGIMKSQTSIRGTISDFCYPNFKKLVLPPSSINIVGASGSGKSWISLRILRDLGEFNKQLELQYLLEMETIYKDFYLKEIPSVTSQGTIPNANVNGENILNSSNSEILNQETLARPVDESLRGVENVSTGVSTQNELTPVASVVQQLGHNLGLEKLLQNNNVKHFKILIIFSKETEELWKRDLNRLNINFFQIDNYRDLLLNNDAVLLISNEVISELVKIVNFNFEYFLLCIIDRIYPNHCPDHISEFISEKIIKKSLFKIFIDSMEWMDEGRLLNLQPIVKLDVPKLFKGRTTFYKFQIPRKNISSEILSNQYIDKITKSTLNFELPNFISLKNLKVVLNDSEKKDRLFSHMKEPCLICIKERGHKMTLSCCNSFICSTCYCRIANSDMTPRCPFCKSRLEINRDSLKMLYISKNISLERLDGRLAIIFNRKELEILKLLPLLFPKIGKFNDNGVTRKSRNLNNLPNILNVKNSLVYKTHSNFYFNYNEKNQVYGSNFDDVKYIIFFDTPLDIDLLEKFKSINRKMPLNVYHFEDVELISS